MSKDENFESNIVPKFPFPKCGDKPFIQTADHRQNSDIRQFRDSDNSRDFSHFRHYCMIVGYKEGADLMVNQALKDDKLSIDLLTFPIVFCYRHYVEISLKFLVFQYGKYAEVQRARRTHKLSKIWEMVKNLIKEYDIEEFRVTAPAVTEIIDAFENLDSGSFSFRYSVDKYGNRIELRQEIFDLDNLANVMSRYENFFEFLNGNLNSLISD